MDTLNIRTWADKVYEEQKIMVRFYLGQGASTSQALEMVLKGSTIGPEYKERLRKEFTQ